MSNDDMTVATGAASVDFLDLADGELYFNEAPVPGVDALIAEAASLYGEPEAEARLLRAYFLAPEQLSVIVALYRYYFYQHRLDDTLIVADRAIALAAHRLGLPADVTQVSVDALAQIEPAQRTLLRFHLLAAKGSVIVLLRLGRHAEARARLATLVQLDTRDQLDVKPLLDVVAEALDESLPLLSKAA